MERRREPIARIVLLGASNLSGGLRTVVDAARARLGGPLDVLAAPGKGRSYALESRFATRALPGIDACGLWRELERRAPLPTYALATDLGNDLAFGARAVQIEAWLARVLDRLQARAAEVVVTRPPLATLLAVPAWEFRLWAALFFPLRTIERELLLAQAQELDERVVALAQARGLVLLAPDPSWYGRDPIHIARAHRAAAWSTYAAGWKRIPTPDARPAPPARLDGRLWYERVRILGFECGRAQPCARLDDGTTLSLY